MVARLADGIDALLECPVPSALIWGPQLISFYNDAYIPLLGNKPFSLGRSFLDIWPEASQVIGPQIEAAFIGEAGRFKNVRFMLDRGKGPEEAYIDYSFSPVRNEAGAVVGVLNIATETTSRELAERRRAEADAALVQSEKRFRALVTAGTYSIYRMSPDWRLMHQLDGRTLASTAEPIDNWQDKYILEEDRPRVRAAIEEAIRTKSLFELEHRVYLADGSVGWVLSRAVPLLDDHGHIVEWFGAGSDVTERRRVQQMLQDSEDHHRDDLEQQVRDRTAELKASHDLLQATMDSSVDMIQVFEAIRDPSGNIVDFKWVLNNHTSESRYGEVRGESLLQRNQGVVQEGIFDAFKRVAETGIPEQAERHYVHEQFDGWFYQSVVKLGDGVATTTKEITDWKIAQAKVAALERQVVEAKLRESEARSQGLVDGLVQGSWEAEGDGKVTLDSPSWRAFTGQSYEEWKDYGWVNAVHPDDRSYAERQWRDAVAVRRMVNAEFRLWHVKSGSWRWTNVRAVPLLGETGEAEKWIGINLDIHDRKVAEEAVRKREALWSLALRTLPVGIALVDPGGETVMANDQMRRFLPSGRIPSRDPARVGRWKGMNPDGSWVAPQDFPGARALRGEVVMPGLQMIYDDEQGGDTWTEVLSAPLLDEEGTVTAALVVVVDVDRTKRSEEAALRSEERLRQFGDASQDILWIRDATSLQWQYLTPAFETVYGLSRRLR
jgi:PAS domain S-box-containing protein